MINLFEEAKRQDILRQIEEDEKVFRVTGKNVSYDDYETDPLVPCGGYEEPTVLSMGQVAKQERHKEIERKHKLEQERKLLKDIEIYKQEFTDSISYIEVV